MVDYRISEGQTIVTQNDDLQIAVVRNDATEVRESYRFIVTFVDDGCVSWDQVRTYLDHVLQEIADYEALVLERPHLADKYNKKAAFLRSRLEWFQSINIRPVTPAALLP